MNNVRILAYKMSQKLNEEEIQSFSGAWGTKTSYTTGIPSFCVDARRGGAVVCDTNGKGDNSND